jgi:hypothetical protein
MCLLSSTWMFSPTLYLYTPPDNNGEGTFLVAKKELEGFQDVKNFVLCQEMALITVMEFNFVIDLLLGLIVEE